MKDIFISIPAQPDRINQRIQSTLETLIEILSNIKAEYRIWGSIIPAAVLGRLHRPLGDIDLLIDKKDLDNLLAKLKERGFEIRQRKMQFWGLRFSWFEAEKTAAAPVSIFYGYFDNQNENVSVPLSKRLKLVTENKILEPVGYSFFGIKFIGIPRETAYLGIYRSRFNPKREHELLIMRSLVGSHKKISFRREVALYFKNAKVPFFGMAYDFLHLLRNAIGKIRISFGKPYDIWKK